jgi:hypothetical protein
MRKSNTQTNGQSPATRGRPFANGNPGRKQGSKNRVTVMAAALLDGEAENLVRAGVNAALAGDVTMLKFLLGRILPRDRRIKLDLPVMNFADDAVEVIGRIAQATADGSITPNEGAALANIVNSHTRAIELADGVKRLDALESKMPEDK